MVQQPCIECITNSCTISQAMSSLNIKDTVLNVIITFIIMNSDTGYGDVSSLLNNYKVCIYHSRNLTQMMTLCPTDAMLEFTSPP